MNVRAQLHINMNIVFVYKCITLVKFTFSKKNRNAPKRELNNCVELVTIE